MVTSQTRGNIREREGDRGKHNKRKEGKEAESYARGNARGNGRGNKRMTVLLDLNETIEEIQVT
jgi:hypothetical protein